jgi:acyl transferase domain-containing protein
MMDIAIVGLSCRLPGGANDPDKLWTMLSEGRSAWSRVPEDRFNAESFYHPDPDVNGSINTQGGYFLDQDVSKFDAGFFGISPNEAQTMDPQQRLLLESVYEGLENAGIPLNTVVGSKTAVFAAIFSRDYLSMLNKDTLDMGKYYMTGVGDAIVANRVSYVFDFRGPSITLDTGCSGSLVAIHLASQSLRAGESNLAIASGVNLILHPDQMIPMSLMQYVTGILDTIKANWISAF